MDQNRINSSSLAFHKSKHTVRNYREKKVRMTMVLSEASYASDTIKIIFRGSKTKPELKWVNIQHFNYKLDLAKRIDSAGTDGRNF